MRVFKLPNFKARDELVLGFWWHINPHIPYKKLMLQGYFLARDHFLRMKSARLLFPCLRWDGRNISCNMCSQKAGWMLGHTLGFYHLQHLVLPTMPHPTRHFPVSSACTAYMAIPISTYDQKFKSWDPGSHSTQLIKKRVLNLITRPLCGAYRQNSNHMLAWTISFTMMVLSETLHLKNLIYPLFGHKHSTPAVPLLFTDQ